MRPTSRGFVVALVALPIAATAQPGQSGGGRQDPTTDQKHWTVPYENSRPRDPFVDPQGRVWFVGQVGNYVAYLDPESGDFRKFEIEAGTNPHNLVVDAKGTVWFTGNRNGRIVKMDPNTGKLTNYTMPDPTVRDPHTMTFDQNGDAWFTAQGAGVVGKLTVATGQIRLWKLGARSRPYGIVIDSNGRPWFDEFGTNKIGTIDPRTLELKEYTLPNERSRPRRIAVTSDDVIWYGDFTQGKLGRLDPRTGHIEEFALPSGGASLPYAMAADDQDRIWLAETGVQPNKLVAFDTKSRAWVSSIVVPGTPNTIRHMVFDRKSRELWWGADVNTLGRIKVPTGIVP
jgi:virginiamycin B lyase